MAEPNATINLREIGLSEITGWSGIYGTEMLQPSRFRKITPNITPLPKDQKWTSTNQDKASELEQVSKVYMAEGRKNGTVLTLQSYSLEKLRISTDSLITLWDKRPDLAMSYEDYHGEEVIVSLGTTSYYEHLAFVKGDIKGLENPRGILISMNVLTNDDFLVFEVGGKAVSAGINQIRPVGGTYDHTGSSPEDIAREELHEELGVGKEHLGSDLDMVLSNIIEDSLGRPVLFYDVKLGLSKSEIISDWSKSETAKSESRELIFIKNDPDEIIEFAKKHSSIDFHPPADAIFCSILNKAIEEKFAYLSSSLATTTPY